MSEHATRSSGSDASVNRDAVVGLARDVFRLDIDAGEPKPQGTIVVIMRPSPHTRTLATVGENDVFRYAIDQTGRTSPGPSPERMHTIFAMQANQAALQSRMASDLAALQELVQQQLQTQQAAHAAQVAHLQAQNEQQQAQLEQQQAQIAQLQADMARVHQP